jgi:membrane-associated phospholipid phosphatase
MKSRLLVFIGIVLFTNYVIAQRYDSTVYSPNSSKVFAVQCYSFAKRIDCYTKPRPFSFVTQVPKTIWNSAKDTFSKKSVSAISAITISTLILIPFDQRITNRTQRLSDDLGVHRDISYTKGIGFNLGSKYIPVYQAPRNFNSALYSVGEGFTSVVISGGMFAYGKLKHDNRSLQTASQIMQSQLAVGVLAQAAKRFAGRESPRVATIRGGAWRPLVSFSNFQKRTSHYDAFPSGHLASMMATVTVLVSNYPEKKWLKPVGYGFIGVVGYAMINNGVHWAGDYPLALGMGYVCAKATVKMNRFVNGDKFKRRG